MDIKEGGWFEFKDDQEIAGRLNPGEKKNAEYVDKNGIGPFKAVKLREQRLGIKVVHYINQGGQHTSVAIWRIKSIEAPF